ncbi:MAG TPA: YceI family protein [Anaeromyxobacteraceae bacterium]|nr:YceI family protein [Anaeromyxobacteraceae bacterium]
MNAARKLSPAAVAANAITYAIDPAHAAAHFRVRHLMVAHVRGELGQVTGEVVLDPADPAASRVEARIDAAGIDTRNADRDAHLRSADFLDVSNHPHVLFRSTSVRPAGEGRLQVSGELTIRGATRPVTLDVELSEEVKDPWGNAKRGVVATAKVNRKEFGITWNAAMDGGGIVVGDVVDVTIEAELVRK